MWSMMHNLKNKGSSKQLGWILNICQQMITSVILSTSRLKQEDCEFKARLACMATTQYMYWRTKVICRVQTFIYELGCLLILEKDNQYITVMLEDVGPFLLKFFSIPVLPSLKKIIKVQVFSRQNSDQKFTVLLNN